MTALLALKGFLLNKRNFKAVTLLHHLAASLFLVADKAGQREVNSFKSARKNILKNAY